jgi:uncharacterized protein (TIGR00251 family)
MAEAVEIEVVTTRAGTVRFEARARPGARSSGVCGVRDGAVVVRLRAPPVDGAANSELLAVLAEVLGVAKRDLVLVRGLSSRSKIVEVVRLPAGEVCSRLGRAVPQPT